MVALVGITKREHERIFASLAMCLLPDCWFTFEFVLDHVFESMIKRNKLRSKLVLFIPNMISLTLFYLVLRVTSNLEPS